MAIKSKIPINPNSNTYIDVESIFQTNKKRSHSSQSRTNRKIKDADISSIIDKYTLKENNKSKLMLTNVSHMQTLQQKQHELTMKSFISQDMQNLVTKD